MGKKYDRQLIVALLGGTDDTETTAQAEALGRKQRDSPLPSEMVTLGRGPEFDSASAGGRLAALRLAVAGRAQIALPLGRQSRLYLVGTCDPVSRTLAGWTPADLAMQLVAVGLREIGLISVVADGAGRDVGRDDDAQVEPGAISFASELHRMLCEEHAVITVLHARIGAVKVLARATLLGDQVHEPGRKLTSRTTGGEASEHHAPRSKLTFRWDGEHQLREWSY